MREVAQLVERDLAKVECGFESRLALFFIAETFSFS